MKLHHHPGCDPRERTLRSCPCGAIDRYVDHQQGLADEHVARIEHEDDER